MTNKIDPDIKVLKACVKALENSTSPRMLKANIDFLVDRFLIHPPKHKKAKP